jgi:hypothetical protein
MKLVKVSYALMNRSIAIVLQVKVRQTLPLVKRHHKAYCDLHYDLVLVDVDIIQFFVYNVVYDKAKEVDRKLLYLMT